MVDYPKLRHDLEAVPIEHEGQRMILLRDALGYCKDPLLISPPLANLLALMNGQNSLRDLQMHFMRRTGELIFAENLEKIVKKLDEHLLLENDRYLQYVAEEVSRYRLDSVRRWQHAGKSYPEDPTALRVFLENLFHPERGGPGLPNTRVQEGRLLGLVAPHIDMQLGGNCFAHAYKAACESAMPRTWVILGTGHEPLENYFALTEKDFETPLGLAQCDKEFCEELVRLAPRNLTADEYKHKREHSVEFQAVFLSFIQPGARIVPLLCSFSLDDWESDQSTIDETVRVLCALAANEKRSVAFLASVDLAHIGPRYGDRLRPDVGTVTEHLACDRSLLASLEHCDHQGFMQEIRREDNRRRICGVAPLYVLTKILHGRAAGRVLHHSYGVVDPHNSFVTFAAMAFYEAE